MPLEIDILKLVCQRLQKASIPYMLTGSLAANFYAVPRMTRDIDIVIEILPSDVKKLVAAFQDDFYLNENAILEAITYQSLFNIIHHNSVLKIDFILRKNLPFRILEFQRKQELLIDNIPISIVSPEDLILSKLFWAKDSLSEMQLKDIKNLMQSLKKLDKEYIQEWVQKLCLSHVYDKVTENA